MPCLKQYQTPPLHRDEQRSCLTAPACEHSNDQNPMVVKTPFQKDHHQQYVGGAMQHILLPGIPWLPYFFAPKFLHFLSATDKISGLLSMPPSLLQTCPMSTLHHST